MQTFARDIDVFYGGKRSSDDFFSPEWAEVNIVWKAASESFNESLIVACGVHSFGSEYSLILVHPSAFQKVNVEEFLVSLRDVFQKRKHAVVRMFISKDVEDKAVVGC